MTLANSGKRLLIVDADAKFREALALEFSRRGYDVATAYSVHSYQALTRDHFDYAAIDHKLDCDSGWQILEHLNQRTQPVG